MKIINQSLASFIDEYFITPPNLSEVKSAIEAVLSGIPLIGENIKTKLAKEKKWI